MREIWKPVDWIDGYEVSNEYRVRNTKTGRILKTYPNNRTGKPQVTLMDKGYRLTRPVHKIVEEAFED